MSSSETFLTKTNSLVGIFRGSNVIWPGLVLVGVITGAGFALRNMPGLSIFSPMILSVMIGILFSNSVGISGNTKEGIRFSQKTLLRSAIILLGFQLTIDQAISIGVSGFLIIAVSLAATFFLTVKLAPLFGVDRQLAELIAAGTSICGASAIVATNAVTNASDEDVAYSVASITLFGTLAMLLYPVIGSLVHLGQEQFGLWVGASIHEVAQVIGASFQYGSQAGEIGTVSKLTRVALLVPVIFAISLAASRQVTEQNTARAPMPYFVLGFVAVVVWNSLIGLPDMLRPFLSFLTTFMLTMGLAAMGLNASIAQIRSRGLRPLLLAFSASLLIGGLSLVLVKLVA